MNARRPPTIPLDVWTLAERVCTPAQLVVLELEGRGLSQGTIALHLGLSRSAVRDRLASAHRNLTIARENAA